MTDLRKVAEMALSVLNLVEKDIDWLDQSPTRKAVRNSARELRQALAQPEQEPVAVEQMMRWVKVLKSFSDNGRYPKIPSGMTAGACYELAEELERFIKTAPPKQWVGLTDEDYDELLTGDWGGSLIQAVEAKLKEKNA